jgi:hypothetical protein
MQYITPKASFSLKCNDISLSDTFVNYPVTNNVGTINATRTIMTWYSINFENILGDLYNDYDLFNLRVRYISYTVTAAYGVNADDRSIFFKMDGLNWYNSNYDVSRTCNTGSSIIAGLTYVPTTSVITSMEDVFISTIRKQKLADITISFLNANSQPPNMAAVTQFPRTSFYFDLTPVIINPSPTIALASTKCSVFSTYYLGNTSTTTNIDMYQVLGAENFKLGAKYNLVFKYAQAGIWGGSSVLVKGGVFNVSSSGMRFQNYETAINKAANNPMQALTYNIFNGLTGNGATTAEVKNQTSGIMTFTLEAQICSLTLLFQNLVNNTEFLTASSNTLVLFDIWKCI